MLNNKGVELQTYFIIEVILGFLFASMLIVAASNFDWLSTVHKEYAEEDLKLLMETVMAGPGKVAYEYQLRASLTPTYGTEDITVTVSDNVLKGYETKNITLTKDYGLATVQVNEHD